MTFNPSDAHPQIDAAAQRLSPDARYEADNNADIQLIHHSTSAIRCSLDELSVMMEDNRDLAELDLTTLKPMVVSITEALYKMNMVMDAIGGFVAEQTSAEVNGAVEGVVVGEVKGVVVGKVKGVDVGEQEPVTPAASVEVDVAIENLEPAAVYALPEARNESEAPNRDTKPPVDTFPELATEGPSGDSCNLPRVKVAERYSDRSLWIPPYIYIIINYLVVMNIECIVFDTFY